MQRWIHAAEPGKGRYEGQQDRRTDPVSVFCGMLRATTVGERAGISPRTYTVGILLFAIDNTTRLRAAPLEHPSRCGHVCGALECRLYSGLLLQPAGVR